MVRVRVVLLLIGLALLLFTATAGAEGPAGCSFSGTVKLDDAEVAGGTLITALIEGVEYNTHTPTGYGYSTYSITIQPPEGKTYPDGTKVVFKVNGHTTDQTAIYKAGASTRLDLAASSKAAAPISTWLTPILVLLLLAGCGVAAYLLFRTIVQRRRLAEPVTAAKAEEAAGELRARYVWDKTKLAWVPTPEPPPARTPKEVPVKSAIKVKQPAASTSVTKKTVIKRSKIAKFPRHDNSPYGIDT
jgi:hypothetical protein